MFGFTGNYKGKRISIQGTGIGIPSTALYLHELIHSYKVNCVMRLGTCGAIQPDLKLGEVILATEAYTDSAAVQSFSNSTSFTPKPSSRLIKIVENISSSLHIALKTGALFSTDLFYSEDPHRYDSYITQGVLGVDMETSLLYAMAEYYKIASLSLLTVSDNILTGTASSAEEREKHADDMIRLALEVIAAKNDPAKS
jgi:purine-nucleoside phosphorylase